jgi:hypothetical protein
MLYGTAGVDYQTLTCLVYGGSSGIVWPGNPPFTVTDFIGIYPKFVGPPTNYTGLTITQGSNTITGFNNTTILGFVPGVLLVNLNSLPKDTIVTAVNTGANTITISNNATQNDTVLTAYLTPFMPILVILTYIFLAQASVMSARYNQSWFIMMCYFVAHYCTLWMRSESGVPNLTASQVAASGLTKGVIVSRQAGDVSARSQLLLGGYDEFGAWGETQYGELFITIARATAMGPIWLP